jgi:substrate-binding family protein
MDTTPSEPGEERTDGSSVQIGALVPLTRPGWVQAGRHLLAGRELAVHEVNDAGGILGRPLELVVRDTAADPQRAATAVDELARLGVAALAGECHSVVVRAAAARADALGLPFLCSSAVLDALTDHPTPMDRTPRPGAVPRLADLRRLPPQRRLQPNRRSSRAERLLGIRGPHPAGLPRSTRRHRHRTRHGKERVDGSSPSEGSSKAPQVGAFSFRSTAPVRTGGGYGAVYGAFALARPHRALSAEPLTMRPTPLARGVQFT